MNQEWTRDSVKNTEGRNFLGGEIEILSKYLVVVGHRGSNLI